jgi:hypothetical protein
MSIVINNSNLEDIIKLNIQIKDEISSLIDNLNIRYNASGVSNKDGLAFKILKNFNLIQVPINDEHFGGAVYLKDNLKIPIINTAQPRVYQYFVAWHEIYHLIYESTECELHTISTDIDLNERKANCFSANIMIGNVYEYYYSLDDEDFINRIIKCIDLYKSPYKAILIHLYESAITYNDSKLKKLIIEHFSEKPNLVERFEELELDTSLVIPSYIVNFSGIDRLIQNKIKENPDVNYHTDNYNFLIKLKKRFKELSRGKK